MPPTKRNFIIITSLLLLAIALALGSIPYRARRAVALYEAQLVASGEKLNLEQLLPRPAPAESNGAPLFRQVMFNWIRGTNLLDKNDPIAMRMVAPGKALVCWAQPDVRSNSGTNTWPEIEAALSPFSSCLEDLRIAAQRPVFDFYLDYRQGPSLLLPHLAQLKRSVQFTTTAALCNLHRGDVMVASTNIQTMLELVRATSTEPLAISQLVRMAMAQITMTATWELLQATNLTEAQLTALQHDWSQLDFIRPGKQSVEFERAFGQMTLTRMRNSSAQFRQILSLGSSGGSPGNGPFPVQIGERIVRETVLETREAGWRLSQSYPDQLRALKGFQVILKAIRELEAGTGFVEVLRRQKDDLDKLGLKRSEDDTSPLFDANWPDLRNLFSNSALSMSRLSERVFLAEVARELTITALALKRYQLAHGTFPQDLEALVPDFLGSLPRDPADGQPLRYRLKSDGTFLLYSIGADGIDNGGDSAPTGGKAKSFSWQHGRDMVWPSPATPEEIRAFEQSRN
jgi:hypothetical protein